MPPLPPPRRDGNFEFPLVPLVPPLVEVQRGESAIVALSLHSGHAIRTALLPHLKISEADRLREEDPFTDVWTTISDNRMVVRRSRFEVDLNRPPERAIYRTPAEAWGLAVWHAPLDAQAVDESMAEYWTFYALLRDMLEDLQSRHRRFVVLDIHAYNHRRGGPHGPSADPRTNPEVNIGTGTMNRRLWAPLVDRFIAELRAFDSQGRSLDVRENVSFRGGHVARWIHERFPLCGCAIAIEIKKFFMDEWSGAADDVAVATIRALLQSTLLGLQEELQVIDTVSAGVVGMR